MSKPIRFTLDVGLDRSPEEVGEMILDVEQWTTFKGWGPLPGIAAAAFDRRLDGIVGTRIAARNTDGSTHVEEIVEWDLPRRIRLRLSDFSPPLSRIATHFDETWQFDTGTEGGTTAKRSFALHARHWWTRPVLWLIRPMLKAALQRHAASSFTPGPV